MGANRTVVIDFPYRIGTRGATNLGTSGGPFAPELPYETMTDAEILGFPIDDFAAERCDLFIWTVHSKLPLAIKVMERHGFKYHAVITWMKSGGTTLMGIHRNTEFVVYGYRGRWQIPKKGRAIRTGFKAPLRGHSVKPREFYEMIRPKTAEPRIDVFARRRHPGFAAWGDQVEGAPA